MGRATEYKDRLGISFPDCHQCDVNAHRIRYLKDERPKYNQISQMVGEHMLFEGPEDEAHPYYKGEYYLEVVLMQTG